MKTLAFYAVFGVVPGYNHNNKLPVLVHRDGRTQLEETEELSNIEIVSNIWQEAMEEEFKQSEILVPAVLSESNTVYPVRFGCPKGGEQTVTVNGHVNPKFARKGYENYHNLYEAMIHEYKAAAIRVCKVVKDELKQTTVSVAFYEIEDFVYLSDKG